MVKKYAITYIFIYLTDPSGNGSTTARRPSAQDNLNNVVKVNNCLEQLGGMHVIGNHQSALTDAGRYGHILVFVYFFLESQLSSRTDLDLCSTVKFGTEHPRHYQVLQ